MPVPRSLRITTKVAGVIVRLLLTIGAVRPLCNDALEDRAGERP
jgi:hypothetical protein